MKTLVILCVALVVAAEDKYDTIGENVDIQTILKNDRLLFSYSRCLLDKGPCTAEVKRFKDTIPEILNTKCAKCTERQKDLAKVFIQEMKAGHPDIWAMFLKKYDPNGNYQKDFQEYLKN